MIKERPIIFSTEMVKAILDGRKTQTRRVVKQKQLYQDFEYLQGFTQRLYMPPSNIREPLHAKDYADKYLKLHTSDVLWVREAFGYDYFNNEHIVYRASDNGEHDLHKDDRKFLKDKRWKSPRFMPKEAARIWLEITDVKVERVQDIIEEDAKAEGVYWAGCALTDMEYGYKFAFQKLWNRINAATENGDYAWSSNPFVWVVSFRVLSKTGKPVIAAHSA